MCKCEECKKKDQEIERLKEREAELNALEAAGVDNWEGYDSAMEMLRAWE